MAHFQKPIDVLEKFPPFSVYTNRYVIRKIVMATAIASWDSVSAMVTGLARRAVNFSVESWTVQNTVSAQLVNDFYLCTYQLTILYVTIFYQVLRDKSGI